MKNFTEVFIVPFVLIKNMPCKHNPRTQLLIFETESLLFGTNKQMCYFF